MNWITIIWSINAGICLTFAVLHLLMWLQDRSARVSLAFSLWTTTVALSGVFELAMMHSPTPEKYAEVYRWASLAFAGMAFTYFPFIRLYLRAGRLWLMGLVFGMVTLTLLIHVTVMPTYPFVEITDLHPISLWGETVVAPVGERTQWSWITGLLLILEISFLGNAAFEGWRQNRRRQVKAMILGFLGSSACSVAITTVVLRDSSSSPIFFSLPSLFVVLVMGYALSYDLLRAHKTTKELNLIRERVSLATSAANLGIWEWDIAGEELRANEVSRERFGLRGSERFSFSRFLGLIHPDDREPIQQAMKNLQKGGNTFEAEYRVMTTDQGTRWIMARGEAKRQPDSNTFLLRGISIDITELKQAEAALRDSEKRLNEAQRIAQIGSWELDLLTNKLIWSDEIFRIFEIDMECFGASYEFFLSTIHPDDRDAVNAAYTQSLETRQPYAVAHRLLMPDGRIKYVHEECETFYSPEGKPLRSVGTVQDITERKKSEQAIIEAEHRYRTVANFTYDWEYWERPNNEIVYMSPSCEYVTGYKNDEFIANPQILEGIIVPEDKNIWATHSHDAQDKSELREVQFRIMKKDGTIRWIEHACRQVFDENGEFAGFRASNRDITARVESREALRRSQKSLQYFTGKLITAQEEERRRLAREMHDDLTQRLALLAIEAGNLEISSPQHNSAMRAKLQEMKKKIIKLSKDIHDISRQIHPAILDDLGLVDALKSECKAFSQREEINVAYNTNNVPAFIPKDIAICVYRITQESLRNIAKYANTNEASVSLIGSDSKLILTVRDNGVGFDTAHMDGQRGIGLSSMKERARLIQGEFSLQSKPGEGTVIKVIAPYTVEQE